MEKFKNLPKIKLIGDSKKPSELEVAVGDIVEMAEIAVTDDARVRGFDLKKEGRYKFLFQQGISQHDNNEGNSRNKPKRFPVYIFGVADEGEEQSLVYAQSIHDNTSEVNIIRLTDVKQILRYRELTYLD